MLRVDGNRGYVPRIQPPDFGTSETAAIPAERILVVEDDRAVQKALRRLFEAERFAVEISADGRSAVEAFRRNPPAAIVLDLRLPTMPGSDVCREIKKQSPNIPIIVLSAASDVSDKVLLLEIGADDYVTKPFSPANCWRGCARRCGGPPAVRWARLSHLTALSWISPKWKWCARENRQCLPRRNSKL